MSLALQLEALFAEEKRIAAQAMRIENRIKELSFQYCESKGYRARLHRTNLEREVREDAERERGEATPLERYLDTGRAFDAE